VDNKAATVNVIMKMKFDAFDNKQFGGREVESDPNLIQNFR